jgi:hypothetical protein
MRPDAEWRAAALSAGKGGWLLVCGQVTDTWPSHSSALVS